MPKRGLFLAKKSINKAEVFRTTGVSTSPLSQLSLNETTKLQADELFLIDKALHIDSCEVLNEFCGQLDSEKTDPTATYCLHVATNVNLQNYLLPGNDTLSPPLLDPP